MSNKHYQPAVLVILDGWGDNPNISHNAILQAQTPNWDTLTANYPHGRINASELHVGLPHGQMGNSEVGHMNIGSGRVVMQDLPRIDKAIADGVLAQNPVLQKMIAQLKETRGACHLMGLLSPGGVHSHQKHIEALATIFSQAGVVVKIHAFLDGRDTPPQSAEGYLRQLQQAIAPLNDVSIATVSGRYYAMDRDKRWDRVQKAYAAMATAQGERAVTSLEALQASYEKGKNDEFVLPTVINDYSGMQKGDALLMANFRADRAREILHALLDSAFDGFVRDAKPALCVAAGMVEYSSALNPMLSTLFLPESLHNILGEVVAAAGKKQLRIAETEKYAHVTFFFNGGREEEFDGEERILVPSPDVPTYDHKPEMSAYEVTDNLVAAIESGKYELIVVNYANTDMVGHTGNVTAASKAVEAVDTCLGKVAEAVLKAGGAALITADHGNAEMMFDEQTGQPHTAHTLNLVPALLIAREMEGRKMQGADGKLADIAPTMLALMGMEQPVEMTGRSLVDDVK